MTTFRTEHPRDSVIRALDAILHASRAVSEELADSATFLQDVEKHVRYIEAMPESEAMALLNRVRDVVA